MYGNSIHGNAFNKKGNFFNKISGATSVKPVFAAFTVGEKYGEETILQVYWVRSQHPATQWNLRVASDNVHTRVTCTSTPFVRYTISSVQPNGVGPGPTLAWPGWKQPDIPVEVDTVRLKTSRSEAGVLKKLSLAGIAKLSQLKGTVSRDFLLQVFFMNHLPPSLW